MGKIKVNNLIFEKMQIFVKTLTGNTLTFEVESDMTVSEVKEQICLEQGISYCSQKIIVGGKLVEDHMTIADLEIDILNLRFSRQYDWWCLNNHGSRNCRIIQKI